MSEVPLFSAINVWTIQESEQGQQGWLVTDQLCRQEIRIEEVQKEILKRRERGKNIHLLCHRLSSHRNS